MRFIGVFLTFAIFCASQAFAGDFARRNIIGFSEDGRLFAFEEYGVQDGSGFPYSNIYIIDTTTDNWTAGSPFRVLIKNIDEENYNETALMVRARTAVHNKAAGALTAITRPGLVVATNRSTERSVLPGRMDFQPRAIVPPIDAAITVTLETYPLKANANCEGLGVTKGFKLTRKAGGKRPTDNVMHEDFKIPKSRSCPLRYDLADVVSYYPPSGSPVMAVLILMQRFGFEGPDGRYLAVTGPLN